jgi:spermidine/putrescine-binding protein
MNTTKLCRWTAVAALAIAAAGTASAASASEEGGELVLWGWASSEAEDTALNGLLEQYSQESGVRGHRDVRAPA